MMKLDGLLWGCSAGLLAGQTLIFAKSYVKLVSNGLDHHQGEPKDLAHPLSILILILLILTGVLQVWCLNRGIFSFCFFFFFSCCIIRTNLISFLFA
jgi:hypothetical protein